MPKKFTGKNTKAVAASEQKQKAKDEANLKQTQKIEEENLKVECKVLERKLKKKENEEKKRQEQFKRRAELKELLQKETESITKAKIKNVGKITKAQIDLHTNPEKPVPKDRNKAAKDEIYLPTPLTENFNRSFLEEETARTINQAIAVLNNSKKSEDRHPEKRLKAGHKAFEEARLRELKITNPTLKLSQLKQMVFKEWQMEVNSV